MTLRTWAALGSVGIATACGVITPGSPTPPPTSPSAALSPRPVRTVIRDTRVYRAGQAAHLTAQRGVRLRIAVSAPRTSRTSLSSSHGYPPQHGYYVTFRVTVANTGRLPVQVGPADFVVRVGHDRAVTTYDGNAPYSGASRQLDTTQVAPGERVSGPLTFDVAAVHGRIAYVPDRSAAAAWTF